MYRIAEEQLHNILDDKQFIKQFALLLSLIIAISLYLIYYSINRVDHISIANIKSSAQAPLSLGEVERSVNGNTISLEVLEDTFTDLAEMDLRELQLAQIASQKADIKRETATVDSTAHNSKAKRSVIEITSVPINSINSKRAKPKSLKYLRKKFYASNDVKYAFAIAERFLEMKKYKEALKWSLIANELAPESDRSWLLFAKTKLKMGKKQDAINILQAYLKTYDSSKVSRFLKKIVSKS
jgi:tetratricopeptide (TPR) repeat protein